MPMPSARSLGSQRRWRIWTGRLWMLAIALGAASAISAMLIIHDNSQRRQAAGLIAVTTAQQVAAAAHERLAPLHGQNGFTLSQLPLDSARRLVRPIFTEIINGDATLARLDSGSLRVRRGDGTVLFGDLAVEKHIRATLHAGTQTESMELEVALSANQIPHVLMMPVRITGLWHTALLLAATVVATALAFGSARREAALAGARGDFIAGVSHDLRMPLAQILLAGETLTMREDLDARERATMSQSIVRESKRLIGLVENLLLYSRSGATELSPRRDVVPVADLLEEVVDAVHLAADDAGQSIDVRVDPGLAVIGDARLLRQAIVNLLDNALKYGTRGQQITIRAAAADQMASITIDDQGPGIPQPERERVFEPYERLMRDESSERTGTGLGLAVVNAIARASGGRVSLADSPSGGTRAVLEIPLAPHSPAIALDASVAST